MDGHIPSDVLKGRPVKWTNNLKNESESKLMLLRFCNLRRKATVLDQNNYKDFRLDYKTEWFESETMSTDQVSFV